MRVGIGKDGDAVHAEFAAGADHAQGDFATICNQNTFEHGSGI
jgi:hypothetical protein